MSRILSIDANQYVVRMAIVEPQGHLDASIDVKPHDTDKLQMFVRSQAIKCSHHLTVVGSPLDKWPQHLQYFVEEEVERVNWVSPNFVRATSFDVSTWLRPRRFDRARLLALAAESSTTQHFDPGDIVRRWQRILIKEMQQRLEDTTPKSF